MALPFYQNCLNPAKDRKVQAQFGDLRVPKTDSDWVLVYNQQSHKAPGGSNSFVPKAAKATTGPIGCGTQLSASNNGSSVL